MRARCARCSGRDVAVIARRLCRRSDPAAGAPAWPTGLLRQKLPRNHNVLAENLDDLALPVANFAQRVKRLFLQFVAHGTDRLLLSDCNIHFVRNRDPIRVGIGRQ